LERAQIIRRVAEFLEHLGILKYPEDRSPLRLNAIDPTTPSRRNRYFARRIAALALRHSTGSPGATPIIGHHERQCDEIGDIGHNPYSPT